MIFVIGDIHGEVFKLQKLLQTLAPYKPEKLIFVGDYLDKGPDSKATLELLIEISRTISCVFLEGDHERAWKENNFSFLEKYGGRKTLQSFGLTTFDTQASKKIILDQYKNFFTTLQNSAQVGNYYSIHTGQGSRYEFLNTRSLHNGLKIIFGHTAFYTPYVDSYKIGIDTGAVYYPEAPLTAFEVTTEFFIDHFGKKTPLSSIAFDSCPTIIRTHDSW